VFIQPIPLRNQVETMTASKMQAKTYSHSKLGKEISCSVELSSNDIVQLYASTMSLPAGWDVKVVRTGVTRNRANAAYFFRTVACLDASPTVVVVRTADGYMVITHDVVAWLQEPTTEVLICAELGDAMAAVDMLIRETAETDDRAG
jgi:hypothetical protein